MRARRPEIHGRYWRQRRLMVLDRDGWTCGICGQPIDPRIRYPDPMSASVHHTRGAETGLDPRYLQAAHKSCNEAVGDPTRLFERDPLPSGGTQW